MKSSVEPYIKYLLTPNSAGHTIWLCEALQFSILMYLQTFSFFKEKDEVEVRWFTRSKIHSVSVNWNETPPFLIHCLLFTPSMSGAKAN